MCMHFSSVVLSGASPRRGHGRCLEIFLISQPKGGGVAADVPPVHGAAHRVTSQMPVLCVTAQFQPGLGERGHLPPSPLLSLSSVPPLSLSLSSFSVKLDVYIWDINDMCFTRLV